MALNLLNNSIEDQLRVEGVNSKGFGQLAKFVLTSPALDPKAKLIYACLVSHTGNEKTAFPGRDLIVKEVGISKDTYYKHMKALIDQGFISVEPMQKGNLLSNNVYTIKFCPEFLKRKPEYKDNGVYTDGWGLIPNLIFRDDRLSWKAKLIYSYLTVYADQKSHMCNPSPARMNKELGVNNHWSTGIFSELTSAGYIEKKQKNEKGRFSGNIYRLIQNPKAMEEEPHVTFSDTEISYTEKPYTGKQDKEKPYTEKSDTNKKNFNNTKINNINPINPSSKEPSGETEGQTESLTFYEIMEYRKKNDTLPYREIIQDDQTRYSFVKGLFKNHRESLSYGDETVFRTLQTCLEELLEEGSDFKSNGITIKPSKVLHYIELLMDAEADFDGVFSGAKIDYENALKNGMIRSSHIEGYLKACLYSRLKSGEMRGEAVFMKDFGEYTDRRTAAGRRFDEEFENFVNDHPGIYERHPGLLKKLSKN